MNVRYSNRTQVQEEQQIAIKLVTQPLSQTRVHKGMWVHPGRRGLPSGSKAAVYPEVRPAQRGNTGGPMPVRFCRHAQPRQHVPPVATSAVSRPAARPLTLGGVHTTSFLPRGWPSTKLLMLATVVLAMFDRASFVRNAEWGVTSTCTRPKGVRAIGGHAGRNWHAHTRHRAPPPHLRVGQQGHELAVPLLHALLGVVHGLRARKCRG